MTDTKTTPNNAFDSARESQEAALKSLKPEKTPPRSDAPKTEINGDKK